MPPITTSVAPPLPAPLRALGLVLLHLGGGCGLLVMLAAAYTAKRQLGIDVVPGIDMLPDAQIEAAIRAVAALVGLAP